MATTQFSGNDFINFMSSSIQNDDTFFLRSYVSLGTMAGESWNSQPYDPEPSNNSAIWKSLQGSAISFKSKIAGNDTAGTESGTLSLFGKPDGLKISASWNNAWTATSQNEQKNVSWSYIGDAKTTFDDYTYKLAHSSKHSEAPTALNSESINLDFSDTNWAYKWNVVVSGTSTNYKGSGTISITDKNDKNTFSMSLVAIVDAAKDSVNLTLSNVKYILSDYTITTAKYAEILNVAQMEALPQISPDADSSLNAIQGNIPSFAEIFIKGDNVISITSTAGASVDAGAGNDTINGGIGDDILAGGTGKDRITGGRGNDTFKISKSDYDFTSSRTILVDTISDFKYTATEQDFISFDGFDDIDVFQTLALAKKAGSTANVIYESKTGNFYYNKNVDIDLIGTLLFANVKGIPDKYWVAAGVI